MYKLVSGTKCMKIMSLTIQDARYLHGLRIRLFWTVQVCLHGAVLLTSETRTGYFSQKTVVLEEYNTDRFQ